MSDYSYRSKYAMRGNNLGDTSATLIYLFPYAVLALFWDPAVVI